jgi:type I restriction enzyme S subunit
MHEGWKYAELGAHVDLLTGYPFKSSEYSTDGRGVRLLRGDNVIQGSIRWADACHWPEDRMEGLAQYQLEVGDLVVALDRTWVKAGLKAATIRHSDLPCLLVQRVARLRGTQALDQYFLAVIVQSHRFIQMVKSSKTETAVPHISPNDIRDFVVALPSLPEQRTIARIMQAWDTAIQKTEQLIAAKERLTRALMRRVFEPTNYPCVRISEFARRITRKNTEGNGHPLTISGAEGLVSQSRYFGKRIAAEHTEHYTLLKHGEFAYNKSYSAGYPLGAIKRLDAHDEGIVSTLYLCFALEEGKAPISDYFAYFCEAGGFNRQIYQVAQEGARNHGLLNVTAEDFFSMRMPFPPSEVQERVVRTLTSAMRELTLLRDQLVALRAQKRGLMQKLLTGQWRLPVHDEAVTA